MLVQKYDLQCTYNEPDDKTYNSTMYVWPAKTQVSLCIDSLYISKLLGYPGVRRRCILYDQRRVWSECDVTVTLFIPLWTAQLSKVNTISECSDQNVQLRRLTGVFARRTRRFVKPIYWRRYIRLAKALIRLLICRPRVCRLIRLFVQVIVGFAMHRPMRDLFVQTITLNTLGKVFNRWHFEIFLSFFQENWICISYKLSPLHETSNPVFLVIKQITIFFLSSAELVQIVIIWYPRAPSVVSLSKTPYPCNLVLVSTQEDSA